MAIKLHRCPNMWVKLEGHPCWKVQKSLDDTGIDYEVVKGPLRRGKRDDAAPWEPLPDDGLPRFDERAPS